MSSLYQINLAIDKPIIDAPNIKTIHLIHSLRDIINDFNKDIEVVHSTPETFVTFCNIF